MELAVKTRTVLGKKVKALRKEGLIPAELYGHGLENVHLSVPAKEFGKIFKAAGKSTVITLLLDKEKKPALIHEVSKDSVSENVTNVSFYQVRMDEKMEAKIPLEFVGEAPAVKEKNATINKAVAEIEVEALPQDLPHVLTVDISSLTDIGMSIHVSDIVAPKGVKILTEPETAVATAMEPAKEEVVETPVDVSDVKVETEEKKAERDAEKGEGGEGDDTK